MQTDVPSLPKQACLPVNRCSLPAAILGSVTFQQHPDKLKIDSIDTLYREIFERLEKLFNPVIRSEHFMHYMSAQFMLEQPEEMGWQTDCRLDRSKATYLRLIRGWFFDPDSGEGAVLKGWAESRFGLIPRFHQDRIRNPGDKNYTRYLQQWAGGLYNTNALETQLDLLYTYCQFELSRRLVDQTHITLYRGCNNINEYETFAGPEGENTVVLLNNVNSFSTNPERADEFGDYIMKIRVPLSKILFYNNLLPGLLKGEEEYIVIGGLYEMSLYRF